MPRGARVQSGSGIYHVMLRGINGQQIFEDKLDYEKFLRILHDCRQVSGFRLYTYCLMGNHIHLLIAPGNEPLSTVFRRIGARFVYWYNIKYQRTGHLFQDRYKSEPIKNDAQFIAAFRYIMQNPVKSGMFNKVEQYPYSSAAVYVYGKDDGLTDIQPATDMLSAVNFSKFLNETSFERFLDVPKAEAMRLTDEQAEVIIKKVSKCENASKIQTLPAEKRDIYLNELHKRGLSIRQISRLTGVSKGIIEKVTKA